MRPISISASPRLRHADVVTLTLIVILEKFVGLNRVIGQGVFRRRRAHAAVTRKPSSSSATSQALRCDHPVDNVTFTVAGRRDDLAARA